MSDTRDSSSSSQQTETGLEVSMQSQTEKISRAAIPPDALTDSITEAGADDPTEEKRKRLLLSTYNSGLRLLARREHSEVELRQKLMSRLKHPRTQRRGRSEKRKHDGKLFQNDQPDHEENYYVDFDSIVDDAIRRLQDHGYQSDDRFVEGSVRNRANRGYGPQYITRELTMKGISPEAIESTIDASVDAHETDWHASARNTVQRRYADAEHDPKVWHRANRFLYRRGFPTDVIRSALGDCPRPPRAEGNEFD